MARFLRNGAAALVFFGLVSCVSSNRYVSDDPGKLDSEVLQAAIRPLYESAGNKYLVVASKPRIISLERDWLEEHASVAGDKEAILHFGDMVGDYEMRNSRGELPSELSLAHAKFVDSRTLSAMFKGDVIGGWKRFRDAFPESYALMYLGLPGYSHDKNWAIVCYSVAQGSLAGEIWVVLLHRTAGNWTVSWRELLDQA